MELQYFNPGQLAILRDALDIAEDMTSNYYQLSQSQWKRHPFDVQTLSDMFGEDVRGDAFAVLKKYMTTGNTEADVLHKGREFYLICLRDHQILKALDRDRGLALLPLLAYILTHELVHIVRFCKFHMRFETQEEESRRKEEKIVHQKTYEILQGLCLPRLSYILGSYGPSRLNMDIWMV